MRGGEGRGEEGGGKGREASERMRQQPLQPSHRLARSLRLCSDQTWWGPAQPPVTSSLHCTGLHCTLLLFLLTKIFIFNPILYWLFASVIQTSTLLIFNKHQTYVKHSQCTPPALPALLHRYEISLCFHYL